jgi:surface antigen
MLAADMVDESEAQDNDSAIDAVFGAKGLTGAITALIGVRRFTTTTQQLTQNVTDEEHALAQLQTTRQAEQQAATADVTGLQHLLAQEQVQEASYRNQASVLTGQGGAIIAQIGSLEGQINQLREEQAAAQAADSAGGATILGGFAPFALGPQTDLFPWGQCTWYVASLHTVTWWGDAWQWAGEAAAQGASEGMTPRVGAIVVWGRGNGYSSDAGHVAYVAAVQSPTSFTVNEGNFLSLGVVDQRQVDTLQDVETFIY